MYNTGNSAFGQNRIVQTDIVVNNIPVPLDGDIQHHTAVDGIIVGSKSCQFRELCTFQFGHKAHGTDVNTENRQIVSGSGFCHVQDGTVTAEADHKIGTVQFPIQSGKTQIPR